MSTVNVGQGGQYATVYDALAANQTNLCVISNVVETASWLFKNLEYSIQIVPSATIMYTGTGPLITTDSDVNAFAIAISGGTIIMEYAQYITDTNSVNGSCVKLEFVTLILKAVSNYFSSSILLLLQCNITCNTLFLSDSDGTVVTADKNTISGNVILSNQGYENIQVRLTNGIVYGSVTLYTNAFDLDLNSRSKFPILYTVDNNTIGILGLNNDNTTANVAYFSGLSLEGNTIGNLFVNSDIPVGVAFSNLTNNTITDNNLAINDYSSWCSLFMVSMSLNSFETEVHIGNVLYSVINDNAFLDVIIGDNDLAAGSLNRSRFIDNTMNTFIINPGLSVGTDLESNEILSTNSNAFVVNGDLEECLVSDNKISGNLIFNGKMLNDTVKGNDVSIIYYNGVVDGDTLTEQINTSVIFNAIASHLSINDTRSCTLTFNSALSSSIISSNFTLVALFKDKVSSTIISSNIGEGSLTFKSKISSSQIVHNIYMKINLKKNCKSIVADNILHKHCK